MYGWIRRSCVRTSARAAIPHRVGDRHAVRPHRVGDRHRRSLQRPLSMEAAAEEADVSSEEDARRRRLLMETVASCVLVLA